MIRRKRVLLCREIKRGIKKAQRFIEEFQLNPDSSAHFAIDAYAKRTFDLFDCAVSCLSTQSYSAIPIILRAALESYAIVVNLVVDNNFIWVLELHQLKEKQRMVEQEKKVLDLKDKIESDDFKKFEHKVNKDVEQYKICIIDGKVDVNKEYGTKMNNIFQRFENAQLQDLHKVVYFLLCQATHSIMISVENLHLTVDQNEWRFSLKSRYTDSVNLYLASILDLVHGIPKRLHEYFGQGDENTLKSLFNYCESIKSKFNFNGDLKKEDKATESDEEPE